MAALLEKDFPMQNQTNKQNQQNQDKKQVSGDHQKQQQAGDKQNGTRDQSQQRKDAPNRDDQRNS